MSAIAKAFVDAQRNFAPALKKSDNPYFGSKYADLAICIEAVIDALHENGIALIQHTAESDKGVIVQTVFLHESGDSIEAGRIFVPASQNSPQAFGSALTYARRYSLMTACGIAPEDDDGNAASKPAIQRKPVNVSQEYDAWATNHGEVASYKTEQDLNNAESGVIQEVTEQVGDDTQDHAPRCVHGDRRWFEGKKKDGSAWGAFFCPQPKGEPQCQPIYYIFGSNGKWRAQ